MRIRKMLVSPKLRTLISTVTSLPSMPAVHTRLVESLANEEISSRELGEIIAEDVGMTAKILQLANSAYFGLYRYVASPSEAAVYLGVETIRALTLSTSVFSIFEKTRLTHFFIERLQRHSVVTGLLAHAIAKAEGLPRKISDSSLVGGLLHDVGKLVLATNCPKEYSDVLASVSKDGVTSHAAEQEIFGATHAEVGAYLLWLWGLPDTVCNAVAFHHNPAEERASTFTAPAAINVADALEHERSDSSDSVCRMNVDMNYLATLGLADRLPEWRRICEKYGETEG
jgi:putative nucleotidyltransferase with HDIG domain